MRCTRFLLAARYLVAASIGTGSATVEIEDLSTPSPVPPGSCVAIGFLGGLDAWNDATKGARRLALGLRAPAAGRYAETLENRRLDVALSLVRRSLDADRDGSLSRDERARARWVIYGQSLGGGSATWLAWRLAELGVPVELLLLLDSVGRWDERIPGNVRLAAVLYQDDGWLIRGESSPELVDPARTELVRVEYDYDRPPGSAISLAGLPWWKLAFRVAHSRMDRDPRVWERARSLALSACGETRLMGGENPDNGRGGGNVWESNPPRTRRARPMTVLKTAGATRPPPLPRLVDLLEPGDHVEEPLHPHPVARLHVPHDSLGAKAGGQPGAGVIRGLGIGDHHVKVDLAVDGYSREREHDPLLTRGYHHGREARARTGVGKRGRRLSGPDPPRTFAGRHEEPLRSPAARKLSSGEAWMEPKHLQELDVGATLMLASEIQQRTSVSQVYEKVDDSTVRNYETGDTRSVSADEIVYPFEPEHAAKNPQ
ncbi:hypothetical protein BH20GEM1_BH20GEM1_07310 [soil metagenome]